jgi:hypothetical protein
MGDRRLNGILARAYPRSATQASVATVFAEPEIDTIKALTPTLEGNTARQ